MKQIFTDILGAIILTSLGVIYLLSFFDILIKQGFMMNEYSITAYFDNNIVEYYEISAHSEAEAIELMGNIELNDFTIELIS